MPTTLPIPDFGLDYMTRDHYAGFGMIMHLTSTIESSLDQIIVAMTQSAFVPAFYPLLTFLTAKDKRDYINAMGSISEWKPEIIKTLNKLMDRAKSANSIRNDIAHCVWKPGRHPGTIKPISLSARGALKVLGSDHNEREWTASQLFEEAEKIHRLGIDLAKFMQAHDLVPAFPERPGEAPPPIRSR